MIRSVLSSVYGNIRSVSLSEYARMKPPYSIILKLCFTLTRLLWLDLLYRVSKLLSNWVVHTFPLTSIPHTNLPARAHDQFLTCAQLFGGIFVVLMSYTISGEGG
jgi:hypothetical protein